MAKINRIFSLALSVLTIIYIMPMNVFAETPSTWDGSIAASFAGGNGTQENPFQIKTAEQLAYFAQKVNSRFYRSFQFYELQADIVLNDNAENYATWGTTPPANEWTPIGTTSLIPFCGNFDGNHHTVSGLYINNNSDFKGLFGRCQEGTIENVGVINSYIKGKDYVGGLAGSTLDGNISSCYNTSLVSGNYAVGGISGDPDGRISNCYNSGSVSGVYCVGGISGDIYLDTTITSCYNTGDVEGDHTVGGIVGSDYSSTVSNCFNTGIVSGKNDVGGVCGYNYNRGGLLTNCYYSGHNIGIGHGPSQDGTTQLTATLDKNIIIVGDTAALTATSPVWNIPNALGSDFEVTFQSDVASISGTIVTGTSAGTGSINMVIKQRELTTDGFTGAIKTIPVGLSIPLTVVTLTNAQTPVFTTNISGIASYTKDTPAIALNVKATVSDGGTISYQWYRNTTNSTTGGTAILGETNANYTPPTDTAGVVYYYAIATNTNISVNGAQTAIATSGVRIITVDTIINAEVPTFTEDLSGETTYTKDTPATALTVSATAPDGGTISYQWYSNPANNTTNGMEIAGETNANYTPPTSTVGTVYYYVIATNTNNFVNGTQTATAVSGVKTITVNTLTNAETPTFTANLSGETTYTKDTPVTELTVSATASDGGTISYQWYSNTENNTTTGAAIAGATGSNYIPPTNAVGTVYYYVIATNTNNTVSGTKTATAASGAIKVIVTSIPTPSVPQVSSTPSTPEDDQLNLTVSQRIGKSLRDNTSYPIQLALSSNKEFVSIRTEFILSKLTNYQILGLKKMTEAQIEAEIRKINEAISTVNTIGVTAAAKAKLKEIKEKLPVSDKVIAINFTKHATFSFPVQVTIQLNKSVYPAGTYQLYFFNPKTDELEDCGVVSVDENGNTTFTILHCSDYVISSSSINSIQRKLNPKPVENPKTGSRISPILLAVIYFHAPVI